MVTYIINIFTVRALFRSGVEKGQKGQIINTLGFEGHLVSILPLQCKNSNRLSLMYGHSYVPIKMYLWRQAAGWLDHSLLIFDLDAYSTS